MKGESKDCQLDFIMTNLRCMKTLPALHLIPGLERVAQPRGAQPGWLQCPITPLCRQAIPDRPLLVLAARLPGHGALQQLRLSVAGCVLCLQEGQQIWNSFLPRKPYKTSLNLSRSHKTNHNLGLCFFEKLGIEGLHFKSTGYLFATQ